jgi:hypothetical protein
MTDVYADIVSLEPNIVRTDAEMEEVQAAENEAMARQQALQEAQATANTAKTLSEVPLKGDSALDGMLSQMNAGRLA